MAGNMRSWSHWAVCQIFTAAFSFGRNCQFSEILEQVNESLRRLYKWQESFSWEEIVGSNDKTIGLSFFPFVSILSQRLQYAAADVSFSIYKRTALISK